MNKIRYEHLESIHNTRSAEILCPQILELFSPKSIVDVGCGIGTWLTVFNSLGVKDVVGVDGEYVNRELLRKYLSEDNFKSVNLEMSFDLNRRFDLAISLEVAEHLSHDSSNLFIESICKHSDTVIFSAAIPGQDGQNHLNEQWPKYWIEKFENLGYQVYDPFRKINWNDSRIDLWYRQNIFVFSKKELSLDKPVIADIVLPDFWIRKVNRIRSLEKNIQRIGEGKGGFFFYLKCIFKSMGYFGRKQ